MVNYEEIDKGNIKLTVFDSFPYEELKLICDKIVELGYKCEIISNGNIVFQKIKEDIIDSENESNEDEIGEVL